ncbi:MAG TPA: hypothetical protein VGA44_03880 [Steroidobacteraceae bacterium]
MVFIHGIFGDAIDTWTNSSGTSFFQLLNDDPNLGGELDLFAFGYTSTMLSGESSFTLQEAANRLHERLKYHGVLAYPGIVFVAHSMGGLVTLRELLTHRELLPQVPLIVFYATPQEGAQITTIARYVSANPALEEMLPGDRNNGLQQLNDEWKEATKEKGPPIICGYEKQPTYSVMVVPWESATRFCYGAALPIDESHLTIVKPDRPEHDSIVLLVNALNEHVVGQALAAKLELPDFVREGDRWSYTLRAALGKQPARIVNAGRLPLRYTIAELSDPSLHIWPDDTPKTLDGGSVQNMQFALAYGAEESEYRFTLRSDAADEQPVTVRVPDLPQIRTEQSALTVRMTEDLNVWLSSEDVQATLAAAPPDDPAVRQLFLERARETVDREIPDAPESLRWVITSEVLRSANWSTLAVEALRNAEKSSPPVVRVPSVQRIAALNAAASGESRIFAGVENPVQLAALAPTPLPAFGAGLNPNDAAELAGRLRSVPALRALGLSLEGDLQQSRGDGDAARRAYEEAAQIRLTPSLSDRIRVLPSPRAELELAPPDRAASPRAELEPTPPDRAASRAVENAVILSPRVRIPANELEQPQ